MTIGERIVFLREERGISQKDLARSLHITAATLSRYENDIYQPKLEFLCEMCRILNTSSDYMLGFTADFEALPRQKASSGDSAGSAHSLISGLSADERALLKMYRSLSEENQIRIRERMQTLQELQK